MTRYMNKILPRNLTWNLRMMVSTRNLLFQGLLFRFHVKFQGCKPCGAFFRKLEWPALCGFQGTAASWCALATAHCSAVLDIFYSPGVCGVANCCRLFINWFMYTWNPQTTVFLLDVWWNNHFSCKDFDFSFQLFMYKYFFILKAKVARSFR